MEIGLSTVGANDMYLRFNAVHKRVKVDAVAVDFADGFGLRPDPGA